MIIPNIQDVKNGLEKYDFPRDIIVEATRHCNLRCIMCPYPILKRPKGVMEFSLFKKIVDETAQKDTDTKIWLAIMGEPLLIGEKLIEFISYAKQQGIKNVNLNTNAVFLSSEMAQGLIDCGLDRVIISIDGATEESYNKIRRGGDFNKVCSNVERMLELREASNSSTPEIIVQFIEMEENAGEAETFKEHWLKRNAVVKIRPKLGWGDAVNSAVLDQTAESTERFPCAWLTRTVSIHWDGSFAQCDADYEGTYSPGDLNHQTIEEVWKGEIAKRSEKHWSGDFDFLPCKNCKDWLAGRSYFYYPAKDL